MIEVLHGTVITMTNAARPWRNVFVLCTGRCGSTTLARAMAHSSNFTVGHETRTHLTGVARLDFPAWHVEIDNRLSWFLGRLDRRFGDTAFYVHLRRDPEAVAESFVRRAHLGIMNAYRSDVLMRAAKLSQDVPLLEFANDYIDTVTENISHFLRDKSFKMDFNLGSASADLMLLWDRIGAEGGLTLALAEMNVRHNHS